MGINLKKKITELLSMEETEIIIIQKENIFEFEFNKKNYLIILEHVKQIKNRNNIIVHELIFSENYYSCLQKSIDIKSVFGYFLYDESKDIFIHYNNLSVIDHLRSTNKSTDEIMLEDVENKGIDLIIDHNQKSSIKFKSKYLGMFLRASSYSQNVLNENEKLNCFDNIYNFDEYTRLEEKIIRIEDSDFIPSINKSLSKKWDREEFIICLDLYLKIKNKIARDAKDDPNLIKVFNILKQKSINENRTIRTIGSIYMRVQNYKHVDDEWRGKGLSGGGEMCKEIFSEFKNNLENLKLEMDHILSKYGESTYSSKIFIRKYQVQDEHSVSKISTKSLDLEEINNLKDRASKLHKQTLNLLSIFMINKEYDVYECAKTFDLLAIKGQESIIFEVKSLNDSNFVSQTRSAFTQIHFYEYIHRDLNSIGFGNHLKKVIVYHDNPSFYTSSKILAVYNKFLLDNKIHLCWNNNGSFEIG